MGENSSPFGTVKMGCVTLDLKGICNYRPNTTPRIIYLYWGGEGKDVKHILIVGEFSPSSLGKELRRAITVILHR